MASWIRDLTHLCPPFQHLLSERRQSLGQQMLKIGCENASVGKNGLTLDFNKLLSTGWNMVSRLNLSLFKIFIIYNNKPNYLYYYRRIKAEWSIFVIQIRNNGHLCSKRLFKMDIFSLQRVGKVTIKELKRRGVTGEFLRREMWGLESAKTTPLHGLVT